MHSVWKTIKGQGRNAPPKITAQDRAILDMKLQRDKLKQYQRKIQVILDRELAIAAEALRSQNRQKALTALRKKRYQESLLRKTDSQLETLENLVSSIEFALIEKDVLFGLKQGTDVLKQLHSEMNMENVEKLMSDTADAIAYQREIDDMLATKISADEEAAVQQELADLLKEALDLPTPPVSVPLPNVPTTEPAIPTAATEQTPAKQAEATNKVALEA